MVFTQNGAWGELKERQGQPCPRTLAFSFFYPAGTTRASRGMQIDLKAFIFLRLHTLKLRLLVNNCIIITNCVNFFKILNEMLKNHISNVENKSTKLYLLCNCGRTISAYLITGKGKCTSISI